MTNSSPLWAIQVAIRDALLADPTIDGLVTGVFDYVPEGTAEPYITVGEAIETPDNTHSGFGHQSVATLHIWTRQRGHAQGLQILEAVKRVLDHQRVTIADRHLVSVRFEFSQTLRDPNPEIRHIPARFRVTTQEV